MAFRIEIDGLAEMRAKLASLDPVLTRSLDDALADSARIVAGRASHNAPKRSGRMAGSVTAVSEGTTAEVRVTAKRVSLGYPGGFPYPKRIERSQPFLGPAVVQESQRVADRMTKVLDEIATKWGGA